MTPSPSLVRPDLCAKQPGTDLRRCELPADQGETRPNEPRKEGGRLWGEYRGSVLGVSIGVSIGGGAAPPAGAFQGVWVRCKIIFTRHSP